MTCDRWQVTGDIWHVTGDMWHKTCDRWRTLCQNFRSLALIVWDLWCFEDLEEKDDLIDNYSAVSADITSCITSNITSSPGPKPQDFCLFVSVFTYFGAGCLNIHFIHPTLPSLGWRMVGWVNWVDIMTSLAIIRKY